MPLPTPPPTPPRPSLSISIPTPHNSPPTPPHSPSQIPLPPSPIPPPPCLQCFLANQKCSLSTAHHLYHLFNSKTPHLIVSCTRCIRNGGDLCLRVRDGEWGNAIGVEFWGGLVVEVDDKVGKRGRVGVEEVEGEEVEERVRELIRESGRLMRPFPRPKDWVEKVECLRDVGGWWWRERWVKEMSGVDAGKWKVEDEEKVGVEQENDGENMKTKKVKKEKDESPSYVLTTRQQLETMLREQREVQESWKLPPDMKMASVTKIRKRLEKKLGVRREVEQIREKLRRKPGLVLEMRKRLEGNIR